jgi:hypothetical protein
MPDKSFIQMIADERRIYVLYPLLFLSDLNSAQVTPLPDLNAHTRNCVLAIMGLSGI